MTVPRIQFLISRDVPSKLFHFPQTLLRVRCSMALRSVSYFRERDQGLDHVHHGARDRGRGEVGQGHVGVGLVEAVGRGDILRCLGQKHGWGGGKLSE